MAAALPLKQPWLKFCLTCIVAQVPSANIKGGGAYCLYCSQPSGGAVGVMTAACVHLQRKMETQDILV